MIIFRNDKPFRILGYHEASLTKSVFQILHDDIPNTEIMLPKDFCILENKEQYQYFVTIGNDPEERKEMINIIDTLNLDCVSYIHESSLIHDSAKIGKGVGIFCFSTIMADAVIGDHCMIDAYCMISHDCILEKNCIVRSGTIIAGRTEVGKNVLFCMKSSVINKINICDDVIIGAYSGVTKDITTPGMYLGTPARLAKSLD
jgi:sugar O-acyltransferase (sialic acid O-acetyltransferase NeuD family)